MEATGKQYKLTISRRIRRLNGPKLLFNKIDVATATTTLDGLTKQAAETILTSLEDYAGIIKDPNAYIQMAAALMGDDQPAGGLLGRPLRGR